MEKDKLMKVEFSFNSALAYIPLLGLSSLFAKGPQTQAELFHARQGFILFTIELLSTMVCFIPVIGWIIFFTLFVFFAYLHIKILVAMSKGNLLRINMLSGIMRLLES